MKKIVSKRIKVTKNGKIMRRKMGGGHCRLGKTSKQKQAFRSDETIANVDKKNIINELMRR